MGVRAGIIKTVLNELIQKVVWLLVSRSSINNKSVWTLSSPAIFAGYLQVFA
jgi:hypothetical protein